MNDPHARFARCPRWRRSQWIGTAWRRWHGVIRVLVAAWLLYALPALAFDLEGHRGARGLAPENTLAAFRRALEIGVTTIETDIAVTKDLVPVISHNPNLVPELVRDATGRWLPAAGPSIHSLTLAELRQYDIGRLNPATKYAHQFPEQQPSDGERFPTLRELLQLVARAKKPVRLNIETKITPDNAGDTVDAATFVRVILDEVQAAKLDDRVTIQSFDWRTLREVKRVAPRMTTSCLTIEAAGMNTMVTDAGGRSPWHAGLRDVDYPSVPALVAAAGCGTWSMYFRNLTPPLVADAHARGIAVLPWTVDERGDMNRLIDMRVDGIITDYPDRLRDVAAERRLSVQ
ncbi:MAG TPA: glycerophosphodiester phosphodiesterase [Casimicrobiaceae bacterium]|nr:glycerophosphodiester phosphodiesterase [Casimicrobiaceae bacterium]